MLHCWYKPKPFSSKKCKYINLDDQSSYVSFLLVLCLRIALVTSDILYTYWLFNEQSKKSCDHNSFERGHSQVFKLQSILFFYR